jgi:hypothetical protein
LGLRLFGFRNLVLALVLVLTAALAWREETSLDFGFHLAAGRYILEHRSWPETDPFTYANSDKPYIDMNGLTQVALALAERGGGLAGVGLLRTVLVLATTGVLWAHARRRGARSPALLLFGFTLAVLAWEQRFFARPELATYLLLALELLLLRRHAEDGKARWLYPIAGLQILWVLAHTLSLLGPAVLGLYALSNLATARRRDPAPWIVLGLTLAALFLNPYGGRGVAFLWHLRTRLESTNIFAGTISELSSPFKPGTPGLLPFLAFKALAGLGAAAALLTLPRRLALFDVALVAVFGGLAATAVRNIGLFVVATLPVLLDAAQRVHDWAATRPQPRRERRPGRRYQNGGLVRSRRPRWLSAIPLGLAVLLALFALSGVLTGAYYIRDRRPGQIGYDFSPGVYPIRTVDYLVEHRLRGPVYNHLNFGGYLIGRLWPQERVFIDGRLEVFGESFFQQYQRINDGSEWAAMIDRYDPNLVIIPHTSLDLLQRLSRDSEWGLVELDGVAAIFLRSRPENAALLNQARANLAHLNRSEGADATPLSPPPPRNLLARWLTPRRFPWEAWGRGNGFYGLGLYEAARREYRRALVESGGDDQPLVTNYASVCFRLGRREEARVWYRRLLVLDPANRLARDRLGALGR